MKFTRLAAVAATTIVLAACGAEKEAEDKVASEATETTEQVVEQATGLESVDQRISYIVGMNMATQFERDGIALDVEALALAVEDKRAGKEPRLSEEDNRKTIAELQARAQEKQKAALAEASAANKAEGEAYLAANAQKEGVVVTESGLQYKEITAGEGATPTADDTVTVHYKGTLIDGTVFDSSYDRGQPASFPVSGVIAGWVEALQLMNVGDKFELAIPSALAYGPSGTGPQIGPDSTLLFEVELLDIAKKDAEDSAADSK